MNLGRLIPACAGNTAYEAEGCKFESAHPRMRGKHGFCSRHEYGHSGSSPHARETLDEARLARGGPRLIPACARNTAQSRAPSRRRPAHPRMRGKHIPVSSEIRASTGSSPHARETRRSRRVASLPTRLIPACAGNTPACSRSLCRTAAHPRMRGKHAELELVPFSTCGSSPHARETPSRGIAQ